MAIRNGFSTVSDHTPPTFLHLQFVHLTTLYRPPRNIYMATANYHFVCQWPPTRHSTTDDTICGHHTYNTKRFYGKCMMHCGLVFTFRDIASRTMLVLVRTSIFVVFLVFTTNSFKAPTCTGPYTTFVAFYSALTVFLLPTESAVPRTQISNCSVLKVGNTYKNISQSSLPLFCYTLWPLQHMGIERSCVCSFVFNH